MLTEFIATFVHCDRQMAITRGGQFQRLLQIDLPGSGIEQIAAANDLGNTLVGVIDHDRQLIGKQAIRPADDKIAHLAG